MKKEENLVVIDADSLVYTVGYKFKNMFIRPMGINKLDEFIKDILVETKAKHYLGFFGAMGSKNFRYGVAKERPYKGTRPEKEDYIKFWEPILKDRMENFWNFIPVDKIEADDACTIAANHNRKKFKKVFIATPDKDLLQLPEMWFYDYNKRIKMYCNETVSNRLFYCQLLKGDTTDNIGGLPGVGDGAAIKAYDAIDKNTGETINETFYISKAREFYHEYLTVTFIDKEIKKLQKQFLLDYKQLNDIKRMTKSIKDEALKEFDPDLSHVTKSAEDIDAYFEEIFALIYMLRTKNEGKVHGFKLCKPFKGDVIDWDSIIEFEAELDEIVDQDDLEILDDI